MGGKVSYKILQAASSSMLEALYSMANYSFIPEVLGGSKFQKPINALQNPNSIKVEKITW